MALAIGSGLVFAGPGVATKQGVARTKPPGTSEFETTRLVRNGQEMARNTIKRNASEGAHNPALNPTGRRPAG